MSKSIVIISTNTAGSPAKNKNITEITINISHKRINTIISIVNATATATTLSYQIVILTTTTIKNSLSNMNDITKMTTTIWIRDNSN